MLSQPTEKVLERHKLFFSIMSWSFVAFLALLVWWCLASYHRCLLFSLTQSVTALFLQLSSAALGFWLAWSYHNISASGNVKTHVRSWRLNPLPHVLSSFAVFLLISWIVRSGSRRKDSCQDGSSPDTNAGARIPIVLGSDNTSRIYEVQRS